ncbi:unnamed protein product [Caenorhabditis bovis]|uniref:Uncharacterized protein n=1 Tax=Caenorhabditis bovis TaxID=2654633 RepID=A0A8S1FB42_9PELO|nr:unnamed protein product [Caenorhabditis bovis]
MPIDISRDDEENNTITVYSYQFGVERLTVKADDVTDEIRNSNAIRYTRDNFMNVRVKPIYYAMSKTGLVNLKVRYNRGIEIKTYGLCGYLDSRSEISENSHLYIWTDIIGLIRLTHRDRRLLAQKRCIDESVVFAPIRLVTLTVRAEFQLNIPDNYHPKWVISSIHPIVEVSSVRNEALVVPGSKNSRRYEALIIGPLKVVMVVTCERLLNYSPKTWPPSIDRLQKMYQGKRDELQKKLRPDYHDNINLEELMAFDPDENETKSLFNPTLSKLRKPKFGSFEI